MYDKATTWEGILAPSAAVGVKYNWALWVLPLNTLLFLTHKKCLGSHAIIANITKAGIQVKFLKVVEPV